ncbi:hypothetical protein [Alteromonas oceanisediminis]|uniref:hypothetical protein n=1 Tax=Alteromonas oceanisediminis TaxID=2836180 RepID=UPI001BDA5B8A|nr:hypothetical protein [Alteromonas oceanisediminis]MBT0586735.1 hypothetical protein [Alteromonas oceanisediminis]
MISAGIIAIMLIILIYFVVRGQSLQREIKLAQNNSKSSLRKVKLTQRQLAFTAAELQRIYAARLESLHKRGLMGQDDHKVASIIIKHVEFVVMKCNEHGMTVEEAVTLAIKNQNLKIDEVNEFIKAQPSDVRMAWCQNTVDGFIAACRSISIGSLNTQAADTESAMTE